MQARAVAQPAPSQIDTQRDVLPLDLTQFAQPLPESIDFRREFRRAVKQEPDPRDFRRLLRPRRERPHSQLSGVEPTAAMAMLSKFALTARSRRTVTGSTGRPRCSSSEIDYFVMAITAAKLMVRHVAFRELICTGELRCVRALSSPQPSLPL
jgi:hypothetical protein